MSNMVTRSSDSARSSAASNGNTSSTEAAQLQVAQYPWACLSNLLIIGAVVASQPSLLCTDCPWQGGNTWLEQGAAPEE